MGAWSINQWGPLREASLKPFRSSDGRDAAVRLRLESIDGHRPPANLVYPLNLKAGHVYRAAIELQSSGPTEIEVMIRRQGFPYDATGIRTLTLKGEGWRQVSFDTAWPDEGVAADLRIAAVRSSTDVTIRRVTVSDRGPLPLRAAGPAASFSSKLVGLHVNQLGVHRMWPAFGQGLLRLWDTGTTWSDLAPTRSQFLEFKSDGWARLDDYVRYAQHGDPRTSILLVLGQPPLWASDNVSAACSYGRGTCGAPASIAIWREYVRTLATRYRGVIKHWELWNEADQPHFYSGSISMAELARTAKEELKAVDPENQLLSASYTKYGLYALEKFLRDGGGEHVDGIAVHWYLGAVPERLVSSIFNVRELMTSYGAGQKPLWNTEGSPLCEERRDGRCVIGALSDIEIEGIVARGILTMWLNGVHGFAYYFLEGVGGQTLALVDPARKTVTSAGHRFGTFAKWMIGSTASSLTGFGEGGHLLTIERAGKTYQVIWSETSLDNKLTLSESMRVAYYQPLGGTWMPIPSDRKVPVGRLPVLLAESV